MWRLIIVSLTDTVVFSMECIAIAVVFTKVRQNPFRTIPILKYQRITFVHPIAMDKLIACVNRS